MAVGEAVDSGAKPCQYLTFRIGADIYGLDILRVREIRGWTAPREIPNLPDFIKGVIDFRGGIVPIIDLRLRFSVPQADYDRETVVILVSVEQSADETIMGVVVDRVADVLDANQGDIRPRPNLGSHLDTRYLPGIVKRGEEMVLLVDVDKLLDPETFGLMEALNEHD